MAHAAGVVRAAVTAADLAEPDSGLSRRRDSVSSSGDSAGGAVVVDFGLSQRALLAVAGRADQVADPITRRLAVPEQSSGGRALDVDAVRAVVHQAVHDVPRAWARWARHDDAQDGFRDDEGVEDYALHLREVLRQSGMDTRECPG
jgi:hypothetical protein